MVDVLDWSIEGFLKRGLVIVLSSLTCVRWRHLNQSPQAMVSLSISLDPAADPEQGRTCGNIQCLSILVAPRTVGGALG